jgi:hypothetical protein
VYEVVWCIDAVVYEVVLCIGSVVHEVVWCIGAIVYEVVWCIGAVDNVASSIRCLSHVVYSRLSHATEIKKWI